LEGVQERRKVGHLGNWSGERTGFSGQAADEQGKSEEQRSPCHPRPPGLAEATEWLIHSETYYIFYFSTE
jgi:hypothetical protein